MIINKIHIDALQNIVSFLIPKDFYSLKTTITMPSDIFWWDKTIDLRTAVKKNIDVTKFIINKSSEITA